MPVNQADIFSHPLYPLVLDLGKTFATKKVITEDILENFYDRIESYRNHSQKHFSDQSCNIDSFMETMLYALLYSLVQSLSREGFDEIESFIQSEIVGNAPEQENIPSPKRNNFPAKAVSILSDWFSKHPSPSEFTKEAKEELSQKTGLTVKQVSTWLTNRRRRERNVKLV